MTTGTTRAGHETAPDDSLLRQIACGDNAAMQVFYARHLKRVYRFALRQVRNPATAEDLTSDVFLDVWQKAHRFEGRSSVTTWLLAITKFKTITALKRRAEAAWDAELVQAVPDPSDDPEATLDKKVKRAIIRKCVSALLPEQRQVTDLIYFRGKSLEEVARIVRIPVNTVKTRVFHARKKLAALLKARGVAGFAA